MDLKKVFLVGTAGFVIVCLGLFYVLTNSIRPGGSAAGGQSQREINLQSMAQKLQSLEEEFHSHKVSMKELEELAMSQKDPDDNRGGHQAYQDANPNAIIEEPKRSGHSQEEESQSSSVCSSSVGIDKAATSNTNMLDVYDLLKFDNPNGGAWKQGWDIQIDHDRFSPSNKLRVFVIPHSHNDPGWIKTFERYFQDQTKHILDSMLEAMSSDPSLRFVWAEISYFHLWWEGLSADKKKTVVGLVEGKQLEFVTGGWVMPDEANSHFYSILLGLTEGHQWLESHLGVKAKNAWSIDPFGMSPTMAYILKRSGLGNMLIQRTHYAVKKHLAELQELEFKWRQNWDSSGSTDILCHMMPFYSYDVPHTCGPEPKVCCQFDFKRMHGVSSMTCPWHAPPQPIVTHNLKERSELLLDQYRKKSMLYRSNVLLVPLGDDFRWENKAEWDAQVTNYAKIFDYINSTPSLQAEVKWGTLEDYFTALLGQQPPFKPNSLTGDFFTYADRDDHYWSGYFTSRPFHKSMDRELMGHLRSAQLIFSLMSAELAKRTGGDLKDNAFVRSLLGKLIKARRSLSLFQHHDGVTGTSTAAVMQDYAEKLYSGLLASNHVMQKSLHVLTHLKDPTFEMDALSEDEVSYNPVSRKIAHSTLPSLNVLVVDRDLEDRLVSVFNPSPHPRSMLTSLHVSTYKVKVVNVDGEPVEFEILPVFEERSTLSKNTFQLNLLANVGPLGVRNFIVKYDENANLTPPDITLFNSPSEVFDTTQFRIKQGTATAIPISISNSHHTLNFNEDGFLRSVSSRGNEQRFEVQMVQYGAGRSNNERSGLYLFIPDGDATPLEVRKPFVKVVQGKFMSYVEVWLKQVKHRVTLYNHPGLEHKGLEVSNVVDIRDEGNYELAMRFKTDIASEGTSYTDLNGFQMIRRKKWDKLPLQANYYPLPSATYIEDGQSRLTLLTRQPLGTASLADGEIEVMMDRRTMQDDNRGANQPANDNLETNNAFRILLETPHCEDKESSSKPPMLSLSAHLTLTDLLHPFRTFSSPSQLTPSSLSAISDYAPASSSSSSSLPCDIELVDMSMLPTYKTPSEDASFAPSNGAAVTIRRLGIDGRFLGDLDVKCTLDKKELGRFSFNHLVGDLFGPKVRQTTLSFVHEGKDLSSNESILMKPMEIYAFKSYFHNSKSKKVKSIKLN